MKIFLGRLQQHGNGTGPEILGLEDCTPYFAAETGATA
jgi:hypothetical protein